VAAKILKLSDYRAAVGSDDEIDLTTAVDAAIRDLQEIIANWGSAAALQRAQECEVMLRRAFVHSLTGQPHSQQ
jgi:hypothetical protein